VRHPWTPASARPSSTGYSGQPRRRGIPLALVGAPASYPWRTEFLLVRPDQHIAWRASHPARIDLHLVTGRALSG
jgi:hypothetical protein